MEWNVSDRECKPRIIITLQLSIPITVDIHNLRE
jgi:hypothetical protein